MATTNHHHHRQRERVVSHHQLSNGLYVSGAPEQYKEKQQAPTTLSPASSSPFSSLVTSPYTGGDVKKSGELGKMFDISVAFPRKSGPLIHGTTRSFTSHSGPLSRFGEDNGTSFHNPNFTTNTIPNSNSNANINVSSLNTNIKPHPNTNGSFYSNPNSKPNSNPRKMSGPLSRQNSGPGLPPNLPTTGLITSGPLSSTGVIPPPPPPPSSSSSCSRKLSGPIYNEGGLSSKCASNQAITKIPTHGKNAFRMNFPRVILWTIIPLFLMGFVAGGFIWGAVQNAILLIVVASLFIALVAVLALHMLIGQGSGLGFVARYPDSGLGQAKEGQYVKITGVITCGSIPLETSYQKVNRCVYTSTGLYEYRSSFNAKPARPKHCVFTWGLRYLERYAVDFYISDYQSGLRALVKVGHGASVSPYVEESIILDTNKRNQELPANFMQWLADRNLSRDDRVMRLKEGYIKEGSTVTVMGVVQRSDDVLMIVAPSQPISTGCQWKRFLLPTILHGVILVSEEDPKADVIPV